MNRFVNGYLDLLSLWFLSKFGKKPMHIFGLLGSLMFFLGFVSVIVNAGTLGFAGNSSVNQQQKQDDANKQAMKAWSLANDYNSPVSQMERLKLAGLNPNLVYGSGSVAGNTTSSPALVGGTVDNLTESVLQYGERGLNAMKGVSQIRATDASTKLAGAQAVTAGAQASNLNAQASINQQKADYESKSLIADINYKTALAKKTNADVVRVAINNVYRNLTGHNHDNRQ